MIVVHGEHGIGIAQIFVLKQGVRREWANQIHPLSAHRGQNWLYDVDLFSPHVAAFTGVRIEPADIDPRLCNSKFLLQILMQDLQGARQAGRGNRIGDIAQWQVSCRQGHAQPFGSQHHDNLIAARRFGKKLGVATETNPGVIDDPLVHRACHQGSKLPIQRPLRRSRQGGQHVGAVGHLQLPRGGGFGQRNGGYSQGSWLLGASLGLGIIGEQLDIESELCCSLGQQLRVGNDHQLYRPAPGGESED